MSDTRLALVSAIWIGLGVALGATMADYFGVAIAYVVGVAVLLIGYVIVQVLDNRERQRERDRRP